MNYQLIKFSRWWGFGFKRLRYYVTDGPDTLDYKWILFLGFYQLRKCRVIKRCSACGKPSRTSICSDCYYEYHESKESLMEANREGYQREEEDEDE